MVWDYVKICRKGESCERLCGGLGMDEVFMNKGEMGVREWGEFEK